MTDSEYTLKLSELKKRFMFSPIRMDSIIARIQSEHDQWKQKHATPEQLKDEEYYLSEMRRAIIQEIESDSDGLNKPLGSLSKRGSRFFDNPYDGRGGFPLRHQENLARIMRGEPGPWHRVLEGIVSRLNSGSIFVFHGCRGTGKTELATAVARRNRELGKQSAYFVLGDLFGWIKSTFKSDCDYETEEDILRSCAAVPLLVLDEVHEISNTEWQGRIFTLMVDARYQNKQDTILITNDSEEKFLSSVGSSVADRIAEVGFFVPCNWTSFRRAAG